MSKSSNPKLGTKGVGTALTAGERDSLLNGGASKGKDGSRVEKPDIEQSQMRIKKEEVVQDEILENMSRGLDNLKQIGVTIRDETDLHMKLLDNLDDEVDKGQSGLKRETARAEHITSDTRTCWLYTAICLLLLVLIALVAARWA
jgi:hypothetical protein